MGIDPGTRAAGYGVVVVAPDRLRLLAAGVVRAPERRPVPERLDRIGTQVEELLTRFRPGVLAIESAFTARNVRSALRLGEGRGVVLAAAGRHGLEVAEYAPAAIKKAVVGNGAASKVQVARMVEATLRTGTLDLGHDATDALAIALTHVFRVLRSPRTISQ